MEVHSYESAEPLPIKLNKPYPTRQWKIGSKYYALCLPEEYKDLTKYDWAALFIEIFRVQRHDDYQIVSQFVGPTEDFSNPELICSVSQFCKFYAKK